MNGGKEEKETIIVVLTREEGEPTKLKRAIKKGKGKLSGDTHNSIETSQNFSQKGSSKDINYMVP